jgi:8-oxo-dGTP pyrophosphatase MutT (NUDIX family)
MSTAHEYSQSPLSARAKRRLAAAVRKAPFTVAFAQSIWRRTRVHFSVGAVGVVFNEDKQVLLVEHIFHPYHPWGLPGGWVERGESPQQAVRRELLVELELAVEVGPVVSAELGFGHHIDLAFLCQPLGTVGNLCRELTDFRWVSPGDLPPMHEFHRLAVLRASEVREF